VSLGREQGQRRGENRQSIPETCQTKLLNPGKLASQSIFEEVWERIAYDSITCSDGEVAHLPCEKTTLNVIIEIGMISVRRNSATVTKTLRGRGRPRSTGSDQLVPMGFRLTALTKVRIETLQFEWYKCHGDRIPKYRVLEEAINLMCRHYFLPNRFWTIPCHCRLGKNSPLNFCAGVLPRLASMYCFLTLATGVILYVFARSDIVARTIAPNFM
jgi:hypothetical protein